MRRILALLIALTMGFVIAHGQQASNQAELKKAQIQLQQYRQEYQKAKAAFARRAKNPNVRSTYIVATVRYATATMTSLALGPKQKYPWALRLYREALRLDPTNHEAKSNADLIVTIYKQMGRPVPNG